MTETDLGKIADTLSGLEVSSPEHPYDRRQRQTDWAVGIVHAVIGGAVGYALK